MCSLAFLPCLLFDLFGDSIKLNSFVESELVVIEHVVVDKINWVLLGPDGKESHGKLDDFLILQLD